MRFPVLVLGTAVLLCLAGAARAEEPAGTSPPNIVVILADDQGWGATSVRMDERVPASASDFIRTPNLEKLAARGVLFSRGYAPHPNCSPSRYSIQTGKSPAQLGMTDVIGRNGGPYYEGNRLLPPRSVKAIDPAEVTIAEWIRKHRPEYATAHIGKWHLAGGGPEKHGYQASTGETSSDEGNRKVDGDPKSVFSLTTRSLNWMAERVKAKEPFFLQVSHHAVHRRAEFRGETEAAVRKRPPGKRHTEWRFAAMTEDLDEGVGRLLRGLEKLGIEDRTYIVYLSDNGTYPVGAPENLNGPLHGWKGTLWEGGVRVPFMVAGPGIAPGRSNARVVGYDLFPTICEWLGIRTLPDGVEGGSLVPALARTGNVKRPQSDLVFHWPHYQHGKGSQPVTTIYRGHHKLHYFWESGKTRLYDLSKDREELVDLTAGMPELSMAMTNALWDDLKRVKAGQPRPNPAYDEAKDPGRRFAELRRRLITEAFPRDLVPGK